uniref:Uncharacterized protein n=1 Tax=Anguilla anguilla TaxID=7936 RepID=A0A0E9QZR3_ANGAN
MVNAFMCYTTHADHMYPVYLPEYRLVTSQ